MSLMIAVYPQPEVAKKLAIRGGEAIDKLHMTLVYIGPDPEPEDIGKAIQAVNRFAAREREYQGPWKGRVSGFGRFSNEEEDVLYAGVDMPLLDQKRAMLKDDLFNVYLDYEHGDHGFTPHITLKYLTETDGIPFERLEPYELDFKTICVVTDDFKYEFPLRSNTSVEYNITLGY